MLLMLQPAIKSPDLDMSETEDLDLKLIAENCQREQSSYKNCLRYGEANYQQMKERMFFAPLSDAEKARIVPNQHYPHECDVLLENERNCLAFWTKISGNYHKKGLFKERTGTPDTSARQFILEEMKSMQKLPYIEVSAEYLRQFAGVNQETI